MATKKEKTIFKTYSLDEAHQNNKEKTKRTTNKSK
jgi:hypothetical protein